MSDEKEITWDGPGVVGRVVWIKKFRFTKKNGSDGDVGFICIADLVDGRKVQFVYHRPPFGFNVYTGFFVMLRDEATLDLYSPKQLWFTTVRKFSFK